VREPTLISSRDNPLVKELRRLAHDNTAYRDQERVWVEGDHLCRAALLRGQKPVFLAIKESKAATVPAEYSRNDIKKIAIRDSIFESISSLESPSDFALVLNLSAQKVVQPKLHTVILDRVQDAGNVGSILRSAAAFGVNQVLALKGTAALWSSKVLRAGMGAHFGLHLVEGLDLAALGQLAVPTVVTSSHGGEFLQNQRLPYPCAWVMGHEGRGVCDDLMAHAAFKVRIGQPGGEESLNVAAAAAICLHASSVKTLSGIV
jgi:RNA methyltransferase, TrmH family